MSKKLDEDATSAEFELDMADELNGDDDENEKTPTDTREATNASVKRAERYARKAAYYSFKSYQIASKSEKRLEVVEKEVANIKRQGFRLPNAISALALVVAFAALALVSCVVSGRLGH